MLNVHFFQNPRFSVASGAIMVSFFSLFGTLFLLTQYLQSVLGYSTVKAGAVLLPQAATIMVAAPLSSVWVQRFGNKRVVATGLFIVSVSFALFALLGTNTSTLVVILVSMVLGLGMGNVMAPATDSIMGSLPRAKAGVGSAVNDTTRQVGGAFGVAVLGSILSSQYTSHFTRACPRRRACRRRQHSEGFGRQRARVSRRRCPPISNIWPRASSTPRRRASSTASTSPRSSRRA